jgi:hypothetical protein
MKSLHFLVPVPHLVRVALLVLHTVAVHLLGGLLPPHLSLPRLLIILFVLRIRRLDETLTLGLVLLSRVAQRLEDLVLLFYGRLDIIDDVLLHRFQVLDRVLVDKAWKENLENRSIYLYSIY